MSDEPCNADEELGKLHSRELDRQLNAEYSAMLDRQRHSQPWPPEGTRVRIVGTQRDGHEGMMLYGITTRLATTHWVECDDKTYWPVFERHEIEVIDASSSN